jgi:hypothetical protein
MTRLTESEGLFPLKFPRKERRVLRCRVCAAAAVQEPASFIAIRGGTVVLEDEALHAYGPSSAARGFLNLFWYGDCSQDPEPRVPLSVVLPIVTAAEDGQFEIRVCSLACLRKFFRSIETELEAVIESAREKPPARRTRRGSGTK